MTDRERRERIDKTLRAIGETVTLPLPEIRGARMAGRAAFANLVHLRDLFDGVVLLLERAQGHGAFVLGRSMFETSLRLGAMENPATRDAVVLRWFQDSNNASRRLAKALDPGGVDEHDQLLKKSNRELAMTRKELGITRLPRRLNIESEAERQGRGEDLANYLTAHAFTHGGYLAALHFRVTHHDTERSTFHLNQAHNIELLESAANFAGRSALLGYRSGCSIFEVPEPDSLPHLLELIEFKDAGRIENVE
jgi:hypothetical protein